MTPTAATPAGRGTKTKPKSRSTGHRGQTAARKPVAPRRVSGPIGGVARPERPPARQPVSRPPRRTSGPTAGRPLHARAAASVLALPDHPLLDRIVRGRYWIPILGVLLAGIVAMQVEVLKLSASMGRSIERGTALQSRNEQLRSSVAQLSDDQRIERLAAAMGMVMPDPSAINFLAVHPSADIRRALANIHQPSASGFLSSLPTIDTPAGAAAATSSTGIMPPPGQPTAPANATTSSVTAPTGSTTTGGASSATTAATTTPVSSSSTTTTVATTNSGSTPSTGAGVTVPQQSTSGG
jgi:hypothetical protein